MEQKSNAVQMSVLLEVYKEELDEAVKNNLLFRAYIKQLEAEIIRLKQTEVKVENNTDLTE